MKWADYGDLPLFSFMRSLFGIALDDVRLWGFEGKHPLCSWLPPWSVDGGRCLPDTSDSSVTDAFDSTRDSSLQPCGYAVAASEGCRLISTRSSGDSLDAYEGYVTRRLGSVPQQKNFHVHEGMCTWEVRFDGGEESDVVTVTIKNQVEPLPFFDFGARSLGLVNEEGNFVQEVSVSTRSKSAWVVGNEQGLNPDAWVSRN